ncbi:MAG: hypothetical protein O8C67_00300 [Candidatus Methanoperedens sp.]|nr:hypothetical protein [Candidatus Methanoperedens sp.]
MAERYLLDKDGILKVHEDHRVKFGESAFSSEFWNKMKKKHGDDEDNLIEKFNRMEKDRRAKKIEV